MRHNSLRTVLLALGFLVLLASPICAQNFPAYVSGSPVASNTQAGDEIPLIRGGATFKIDPAILIGGSGLTQLTGDVLAGPGTGSQVATLATSGVGAGIYGDATHVPQCTFDAKGRATLCANVLISGGGGGSLTLTDGVHTVAGTTQITTNCAVGGTTPNATQTCGDAFLGVAQLFSKSQGVTPVSLTPGATITPDFSASNNYSVTLGAAANAIANPTNIVAGKSYHIVLTQDGTGGRTVASWGTDFKWSGGTAPTLSTAASAIDLVSCYVADATHFLCGAVLSFQ